MKPLYITGETFPCQVSPDRIHFLNTGHSDAILLESRGLFALIDAGEDTDYPPNKPNLKLKGYEQAVLAYLKRHAACEDGTVRLEFVLGTHAHSDHLGGFDTVILDPKIVIKQAYLKEYREAPINRYERTRWDNQEVYDQMLSALRARVVPVTDQFPAQGMSFGNFHLDFYNTQYDNSGKAIGENDNSVVVKVSKGERSALLTGDLDNLSGDEKRLAPTIGHVDLLKLGHHGYIGSTTFGFVRRLSPVMAVVTNGKKFVYPHVRATLLLNRVPLAATVDNRGLIATFTDDGRLLLTNQIMD